DLQRRRLGRQRRDEIGDLDRADDGAQSLAREHRRRALPPQLRPGRKALLLLSDAGGFVAFTDVAPSHSAARPSRCAAGYGGATSVYVRSAAPRRRSVKTPRSFMAIGRPVVSAAASAVVVVIRS